MDKSEIERHIGRVDNAEDVDDIEGIFGHLGFMTERSTIEGGTILSRKYFTTVRNIEEYQKLFISAEASMGGQFVRLRGTPKGGKIPRDIVWFNYSGDGATDHSWKQLDRLKRMARGFKVPYRVEDKRWHRPGGGSGDVKVEDWEP